MSLTSFKLLVLLSIAANLAGITRGLARSTEITAVARDEQEGPKHPRELARPSDEVMTDSLNLIDSSPKQKRRLQSSQHYVCVSLPWRLLPQTCFSRPGRLPGGMSKIRNTASTVNIRGSRLRRIAILNWWQQVKLGGKPSPPMPGDPDWVPDTRFGRASQL
ncbi:uncharacterized protein LOC144859763 [Branchiostoma floridae x Branchiostoma japonicum]